MRLAICGLAALMAVAAGPVKAAPADAAMATLQRFADSFNRGDTKTAGALQADDSAIVDEFPPHQWHGPGAFSAWLGDFAKDAAAKGESDQHLAVGKPTRVDLDGDTAYVVAPALYTFKQHGKPMAESAQMTFALRNGASGWKIAAWAFAGSIPHAAGER
ncbi:MAG TPA: nuclear transport factor 2 family protein [Caulobacteraceae bacterium]|jgi:ketosteroid isomerase-like protein|nr:nuclear transport factor 2 family protein [Caulobacteraceae bacterium]